MDGSTHHGHLGIPDRRTPTLRHCSRILSTGEIMQTFNKYGWYATIRLPRHPPPYYSGPGSSHGHGDENLDAMSHSAHREHLPRSQCGYTAQAHEPGVAAAQNLIDHNARTITCHHRHDSRYPGTKLKSLASSSPLSSQHSVLLSRAGSGSAARSRTHQSRLPLARGPDVTVDPGKLMPFSRHRASTNAASVASSTSRERRDLGP